MNVLVVDDDPAIGRSLQLQLRCHGHEVEVAETAAAGLEAARLHSPQVVFLDLQLPDQHGLEVLPELLRREPAPLVVIITGRQDMQATIGAIRCGAFDYIRKPLDLDDVLLALTKAAHHVAQSGDSVPLSGAHTPAREIIGKSRGIIEVLTQVAHCSAVRVNVLIEGESGTGKELVARAIHEASAPGRPFVAINCVALAAGVWESEMFGHERGAFTGADRTHRGRLELAGDGSAFLDEVGDLAPDMQGKLLRVLQEREFERVGGTAHIPLEARIIAATNRDLRAMVGEGRFREDLLHRLEVARIHVPPLRQRQEDIPLLVEALLQRISGAFGRPIRAISEEALERLERHDWPGNVRELENVLMRSVAFCCGDVLTSVEVPQSEGGASGKQGGATRWRLEEAERDHLRQALEHFAWNVSQTARALDISPTTLRKKIRDYGLEKRNEPSP